LSYTYGGMASFGNYLRGTWCTSFFITCTRESIPGISCVADTRETS